MVGTGTVGEVVVGQGGSQVGGGGDGVDYDYNNECNQLNG